MPSAGVRGVRVTAADSFLAEKVKFMAYLRGGNFLYCSRFLRICQGKKLACAACRTGEFSFYFFRQSISGMESTHRPIHTAIMPV